jgi:hypothetical protein
MLNDAVTSEGEEGTVEVVDVATLLLGSARG